jgi:hypothetical protein
VGFQGWHAPGRKLLELGALPQQVKNVMFIKSSLILY